MNKYLEQLEKSAGNRLVKYISENRGNFPLSRLKGLTEKGVLRTPEHLIEGREKGTDALIKAISKRHGANEVIEEKPRLLVSYGTTYVNRQTQPLGQYSMATMRSPDHGPLSQLNIPARAQGTKGDWAGNVKRLGDTHVGRHEAFELDEAQRQIAKGRVRYDPNSTSKDALPSGNQVYSHTSPAVLLRESRDMADNPYAHLTAPSDFKKQVKSMIETQKNPLRTITRDEAAVDVPGALNVLRYNSGENRFIRALQRGKPYQSKPTSSDIRRARNMPDQKAKDLEKEFEPKGILEKLKRGVNANVDMYRGNPAWRS